MANYYDAKHLSSTSSTQVQMTNWWRIVIPGLDDLTMMVRNCSIPELTTDPVDLPFGNSKAKVPGQATFGESTVSFHDAIKKDIANKILEWQKQVYNPETGLMGWVDQFKKDVEITQYGPDGTCERSWTLYGAWPSTVNYGQLTYESSDALMVEVTLQVDYLNRTK